MKEKVIPFEEAHHATVVGIPDQGEPDTRR
jgi:hypothetical protein